MFHVSGAGRDMRVSCLTEPDFADSPQDHYSQQQSAQQLLNEGSLAPSALAAAVQYAARQGRFGTALTASRNPTDILS